LKTSHDVNSFYCGVDQLEVFLKKYALQSQASHASRSYVSLKNNKIAGYYTLSYGSISSDKTPKRISKGMGRYPIPIMVLARLAVDLDFQKMGLGESLLKDAFKRTINASEIAGLRAMFVVAKNKKAYTFYKKYGFMESGVDEFHLFLLLKDILKSI
jgi:ribosomal protein S18 acetylase RimI-like enzyme